jgi:acyl-CoA synthetase (AMP-forming)/AMP-acid ligase II
MTESGGPYCGDRLDTDMPALAHGSCGRPFAGMEVRIVDPDSGEPLPADREGEIRLRGPAMLRGLCGRTRDEVFDRDGFHPTGDMGRLDAAGYLWFSGRRDDMVKIRGATVYPSEVEAALRAIPGVRQAFVADVTTEDGTSEIGALLVADAPHDALAVEARARLSAFKVPTLWVVAADADAVPLSATGKIVKHSLQELLRARGARASRQQEERAK